MKKLLIKHLMEILCQKTLIVENSFVKKLILRSSGFGVQSSKFINY